MALSLTFTGFVQEVKTFDWGSVLVVAHNNRQKHPATGEWETTSKDYIDVSIDPASEWAWALDLKESQRVTITGNAKLSTYPKKDGTQGVKIKVWPKDIDVEESAAPTVDTSDVPF